MSTEISRFSPFKPTSSRWRDGWLISMTTIGGWMMVYYPGEAPFVIRSEEWNEMPDRGPWVDPDLRTPVPAVHMTRTSDQQRFLAENALPMLRALLDVHLSPNSEACLSPEGLAEIHRIVGAARVAGFDTIALSEDRSVW